MCNFLEPESTKARFDFIRRTNALAGRDGYFIDEVRVYGTIFDDEKGPNTYHKLDPPVIQYTTRPVPKE